MKGNINPEYVLEVRKLIGKYFMEMRKSKGYSQTEFAQIVGLTQTTVSKIEAGVWNFTIDIIILFALHLDFNPLFVEKGVSIESILKTIETLKEISNKNGR